MMMDYLLFFYYSSTILRIAQYIYINRYIERLIDSHIRKVKRDRNKKKKKKLCIHHYYRKRGEAPNH